MIFEMVVDYQSAGWGLNTYDGSKMYLKDITLYKSVFHKEITYFTYAIIFPTLYLFQITNRYSNDLIGELFDHGVEIPSFRYLMPADFYFRYPSTDKVMEFC